MSYKDQWITERKENKKSIFQRSVGNLLLCLGFLLLPLALSISMSYTHILENGNESLRNLVGFLVSITVVWTYVALFTMLLFWFVVVSCLWCARKIQAGRGSDLSGDKTDSQRLKEFDGIFKGLYYVKFGWFNGFRSTLVTIFELAFVVVLAAAGWTWTAFFFLLATILCKLAGKGIGATGKSYVKLLDDDTFAEKLVDANNVIEAKALSNGETT